MTQSADGYSLRGFAAEAEAIVRASASEAQLLRDLKPRMDRLLRTPRSLPRAAFAPRKDRFANNLLYRPKDAAFSITGGAWAPGQTTPIHDHLTWAVVGVYAGEERESIYRRTDDGSDPKRATLVLASERINRKGHVTVLGRTGIHRIDNVSTKPSHSVHVYGRDIGSLERHAYDPVTGEIGKFVSGYCNVLRAEDED
ncbi:MAG TPA: cysteine dioxygenase family protein [Thermoplasmata archaeon]|nr:cysteine dioxygenase family protein [Thermoplasmata archaeon]